MRNLPLASFLLFVVAIPMFGSAVPPVGDFNSDGKADLFWRKESTGENVLYLMNGATISSTAYLMTSGGTRKVVGTGDFDGNSRSGDVIWFDNSTAESDIWVITGVNPARTAGNALPKPNSANWKIVGVLDLNGDGRTDIFWQNRVTGETVVWKTIWVAPPNGDPGHVEFTTTTLATVSDLNWSVAATGDFNADGLDDVFWHNSATGENVIWLIGAPGIIASAQYTNTVSDLNWKVVGSGDLDGDLKWDLVWWNQVSGDVVVWLMNGATLSTGAYVTTPNDTNWRINAVSDFDGDGKTDFMWQHLSTRDVVVWLMNGATISQGSLVGNPNDSSWVVVAPRQNQ